MFSILDRRGEGFGICLEKILHDTFPQQYAARAAYYHHCWLGHNLQIGCNFIYLIISRSMVLNNIMKCIFIQKQFIQIITIRHLNTFYLKH